MLSIFLAVQVVLGITLIVLVLLQQGKGADMGAAFGSGASGTVFGAQGAGNFMTRATAIVATLFMVNSLLLSTSWILGQRQAASVTEIPGSVVNEAPAEKTPAAPVPQLPAADDLPALEVPADKTLTAPADAAQKSPADLPN